MATALATASAAKLTPDDLLRLPDEGNGFELVNGELVELNVSFLSSWVAGRVMARLINFVEPSGLGWVVSEGTSFRCFRAAPDRVRRADGGVSST